MNNSEELLARLMNFLTEKFKNRLVLKGGMLLRILDSPRQTQDLDYVWIREKKRNLFAKDIEEALLGFQGVSVKKVAVNSRGIFFSIIDNQTNTLVKIEISVVKHLKEPQTLTNAKFVKPFSLPGVIITAMASSEALSHKIAASLERDLMRDLYDLSILEPITFFDVEVLKERLSKLEINRSKPKKVNFQEAAEMLRKRLANMNQKRIEEELGASLPKEYLPGLDLIIRASVTRLIQRLEIAV